MAGFQLWGTQLSCCFAPVFGTTTSVSSKSPRRFAQELRAVSDVESGQWEVIAKDLGFTTNAINKIKNDIRKYVARLENAIDA